MLDPLSISTMLGVPSIATGGSEMAKKPEKIDASEAGKKGGAIRAKKLTSEERAAIARTGAYARWGKSPPPRATHEGVIRLADGIGVASAVLEDRTRVLSQRGLAEAMGASKPPSMTRRGSGELPAILSAANLKPFIPKELSATTNYIEYIPAHGGRTAFGIKAEVIPMILRVWADADDAQALQHNQKHLAVKAKILLRALAGVGIIALVDEATGYEDDREYGELAKILRAFVAKELQEWVPTFGIGFYKLICEVRNEPISRAYKRPAYFGHLTNELVYRRLAPGVLAELRRKNPANDKGNRRAKHHQFLTRDIGHPKLQRHLGEIETLLRAVKYQGGDWSAFMELLNQTHKPYVDMPLFQGLPDDPPEQ
jgi:hypothetical protein